MKQRPSPIAMMFEAAQGRLQGQPLLPSAPGPSAETERQALLVVASAARAWWEARRPPGWSLEQHLAQPGHGLEGADEVLAGVVAQLLRARPRDDGDQLPGAVRHAGEDPHASSR